MMWFLGILWECVAFIFGLGWDIFIWLWQDIPMMMCLISFGAVFWIFMIGSFISAIGGVIEAIFDLIGSIFK